MKIQVAGPTDYGDLIDSSGISQEITDRATRPTSEPKEMDAQIEAVEAATKQPAPQVNRRS